MISTKKLLITAISGTIALSSFHTIDDAQAGERKVYWCYEGSENPSEWGKLSPEFVTCEIGHSQSPIDIHSFKEKTLSETIYADIEFDYRSTPLEVVNNGHTIQVNYSQGSSVKINDQKYELLQFHFHTPSEHTFEGKAYPMEAHLVHQNSSGEYAVIGLLIKTGQDNQLMKTVWAQIPETGEVKTVRDISIDVSNFLPANQAYYGYQGSLTTSPCSEGVDWYVILVAKYYLTNEFSLPEDFIR
ncbi:MAG: carbonic anhydrase family protein [Cyanobacteria bacterium P01_E01_bin.35]